MTSFATLHTQHKLMQQQEQAREEHGRHRQLEVDLIECQVYGSLAPVICCDMRRLLMRATAYSQVRPLTSMRASRKSD